MLAVFKFWFLDLIMPNDMFKDYLLHQLQTALKINILIAHLSMGESHSNKSILLAWDLALL